MVLGCFSFLFFQSLEEFRCYRQFYGAFWSEEELFRFFWSVDQVLQNTLGFAGSLWRSFRSVSKVSGCLHECQDVSRCVWTKSSGVACRFTEF